MSAAEEPHEPVVTVVVPAWDAYVGPCLAEALASVREQGCPTRVLVVDNASSHPVEVPDDVELVTAPHRLSLGRARQFGLECVDTPYVVFWDADDVMLPGTLSLLVREISAEPRLVAFACAILDAETGCRHRWPRRWMPRLLRHRRAFALLHSVWSLYPTVGATAMRTEAVRASGGFDDTDSGDDWALGVSLLFRGPVGWSEHPGRLYHDTPSSIWARHSTLRHLVVHARIVRRRIREDRGIPLWGRILLPGIWAGQWLALLLVHLPLTTARALRRRPDTELAQPRAITSPVAEVRERRSSSRS